MAPRGPKLGPRWPQNGPKWPHDGPQTQDLPKTAQDGPRTALRQLQARLRSPQTSVMHMLMFHSYYRTSACLCKQALSIFPCDMHTTTHAPFLCLEAVLRVYAVTMLMHRTSFWRCTRSLSSGSRYVLVGNADSRKCPLFSCNYLSFVCTIFLACTCVYWKDVSSSIFRVESSPRRTLPSERMDPTDSSSS